MGVAREIDDRQFALVSKALADPNRLRLIQKIGESKDAPNCSCAREWLNVSPATMSHHLKELERAGLVTLERNGKFVRIQLRRDVLKAYAKRLSSI